MTNKNILIVGAGDVGNALAKILGKKYRIYKVGRSLKNKYIGTDFSVMHICFPYNRSFVKYCCDYINQYKPKLVIINSTVATGTTQKIIKRSGFRAVVHSPVIGDHTNLSLGIKTFTKTIGADNRYYGQKASQHFQAVGIKTKTIKNSKATELGKLLLTTQYALNIAFHQEMERVCKGEGVDFSSAVTNLKNIYNDGYAKIRPNVVMANLFPGKIGGSCLMQNINILQCNNKSDFLKAITRSNSKKTR